MRDQSEQVAERVRRVLRGRFDVPPDGTFVDRAGEVVSGQIDDEPAVPEAGRARPIGRLVDRVAVRLPARLDPGRGAALAVGTAVLLAALVTGGWVLLQRPASVPVAAAGVAGVSATPVGSGAPGSGTRTRSGSGSGTSPGSASGGASGAGSAAAPTEVVVDVAGKVRRPGLYRLPAGARIDDAVRAAGGALHGVDLSSLNLAQKVVDGQQVAVGVVAAPGGPGRSGPSGTDVSSVGAGSAPVNLNSATLEQLETLPGVGPVLAQHILDWRTDHGSFASVDQLDDVTGIGTVKFAALKPLVAV